MTENRPDDTKKRHKIVKSYIQARRNVTDYRISSPPMGYFIFLSLDVINNISTSHHNKSAGYIFEFSHSLHTIDGVSVIRGAPHIVTVNYGN